MSNNLTYNDSENNTIELIQSYHFNHNVVFKNLSNGTQLYLVSILFERHSCKTILSYFA